jgi:hypothetical protein
MGGSYGPRSAYGVADSNNILGAGNWTVTFDQALIGVQVQCEVHHIAIAGPSGSSFQVYIDNTFYDYVARGDINSWDPSQPMLINPGQTLYFYWNSAVNPAPKVSIYLRATT